MVSVDLARGFLHRGSIAGGGGGGGGEGLQGAHYFAVQNQR